MTQGQPYMVSVDARGEGEWTIVNRRDGSRQWAHRGRPVYTYYRDNNEGDMYGHGTQWVAVGINVR